jgi:CRP/FNR family transcriptional regulator
MDPSLDRATLLQLYPAFAALAPGRLDELLHPQNVVLIREGARIFAAGELCQGMPLLVEGSVKVVKYAASGRELMLYRVRPGGSCILSTSCLLGRANYNADGYAETPLKLLVMPAPLFNRQLAESAAFRDFVFHLFAERIAELMQLVEEVAFARLDVRLAKLLAGREQGLLEVTHQQLADELGSVREIVSRLLKGFAAQGLIALGREQITIVDRAGLQRLAAL